MDVPGTVIDRWASQRFFCSTNFVSASSGGEIVNGSLRDSGNGTAGLPRATPTCPELGAVDLTNRQPTVGNRVKRGETLKILVESHSSALKPKKNLRAKKGKPRET